MKVSYFVRIALISLLMTACKFTLNDTKNIKKDSLALENHVTHNYRDQSEDKKMMTDYSNIFGDSLLILLVKSSSLLNV